MKNPSLHLLGKEMVKILYRKLGTIIDWTMILKIKIILTIA
jgi:hypothetical protein